MEKYKKRKTRKYLIILIMLFVGISAVFLVGKFNSVIATNTILESLDRKERKQFAMFIKNSENNQYETYEGDSFPEGYRANLDKSLCTDINGNIIKDAISNSDNGITVTSNKTIYCEIYLDEKGLSGAKFSENIAIGLNNTTESVDELRLRYQGTNDIVTDNYICFGTTSKEECLNNQDKYMYRIIGIDKSNRIKVIKKTPISQGNNKEFYWHSDGAGTTWPNSDLYKGLNSISGGTYSNLFIGNSTYFPSGKDWENKIAQVNWKYGDIYNFEETASVIIRLEQSFTTIISAKIGLMNLSDYYYAYQKEGLSCESSKTQCKESWIHISQNAPEVSPQNDWTMINWIYPDIPNEIFAFYIMSSGDMLNMPTTANNVSVRPVFYLIPTIELLGTGTQTDPYIVIN